MLRERAANAKIQLDFIELFFLKNKPTEKSVRTFSGKRARRSEQHGADKQQTSRRLHLPRRSSALVHNPAGEVSLFAPPTWLPDFLIYLFIYLNYFVPRAGLLAPLQALVCFFNLCDFLPGILSLLLVKRQSAQERRRAPVKARAGSGRLSRPRPPHHHIYLSSIQVFTFWT